MEKEKDWLELDWSDSTDIDNKAHVCVSVPINDSPKEDERNPKILDH